VEYDRGFAAVSGFTPEDLFGGRVLTSTGEAPRSTASSGVPPGRLDEGYNRMPLIVI
jgi:hypothetical protein